MERGGVTMREVAEELKRRGVNTKGLSIKQAVEIYNSKQGVNVDGKRLISLEDES